MAEILNRAEFRAWLEANKRSIVGVTVKCDDCPMARFLREVKGKRYVYVGANRYTLRSKLRDLPEWASTFVRQCDQGKKLFTSITGATALRLLDGIGE